jgi:hypothetical protein
MRYKPKNKNITKLKKYLNDSLGTNNKQNKFRENIRK